MPAISDTSPTIGATWATVGEPLRTMQQPRRHVRGAGVFSMRWGRNPVARLIARLLRLPPPGRDQVAALSVEPDGAVSTWRRTFGGVTLCTTQAVCTRGLTERFGPLELTFELHAGADSVAFVQRSAALCWGSIRIALPPWMAVTVRGQAFNRRRGRAVHAAVEVLLPLLGTLLAYTTTMHVEQVQS
jgi:hypothetical protein